MTELALGLIILGITLSVVLNWDETKEVIGALLLMAAVVTVAYWIGVWTLRIAK